MLAAILTICGTTAFTSCSEEDDNSVSPKMAQLPGTWYTEYDQPGMIEVGDSVITYSKVVQACIFNDDGRGRWYRIYLDNLSEPIEEEGGWYSGDLTTPSTMMVW